MVELIEKLIGRGFQVIVHDKQVSLANLQGANRAYIEATIPHISSLMVDDVDQILASCDVIVIGNKAPEYKDVFGKLRDVITSYSIHYTKLYDSGFLVCVAHIHS